MVVGIHIKRSSVHLSDFISDISNTSFGNLLKPSKVDLSNCFNPVSLKLINLRNFKFSK